MGNENAENTLAIARELDCFEIEKYKAISEGHRIIGQYEDIEVLRELAEDYSKIYFDHNKEVFYLLVF